MRLVMCQIFLLYVISIYANKLLADLPEDMSKYIVVEMPAISKYLSSLYSDKQINLMLERATDHLIARFKESIVKTPSFKRDELIKVINEKIEGFNSYDVIKTALQSEEIKKIISIYDAEVVGDVINLRYEGLILPFVLSKPSAEVFRLKLRGIPIEPKQDKDCLILDIHPNERNFEIEWLGTEIACPINPIGQGNFLLSMAENIARTLNYPGIDLIDISTVRCEKNRKPINLRMLKIFQHGQGWYESKGYAQKSENAAKSYEESVKKLVNYELSQLKSDLLNMNYISDLKRYERYDGELIKTLLEMIDEYLAKNSQYKFSTFMSEIYVKRCDLYVEIYNLMFSNNQYRKVLPIENFIPKNNIIRKNLEKG